MPSLTSQLGGPEDGINQSNFPARPVPGRAACQGDKRACLIISRLCFVMKEHGDD